MIADIGHPAFAVQDVERTLDFYARLGIREAFRLHHPDGSLMLIYLHVAGDRFVEVFPGGPSPDPARRASFMHLAVRLAATLQDHAFRPVTEARVNVKVNGPVSREVVLESRGQGAYGTVLDNLPPGRYTASATAAVGGRSAGSANAEFWVDAQSIEWQDVAPDAGLLAQVAQASGGRTVKPGREGDVAAALAMARPRAARDASVRLWESPIVFALLASILSAEWWIRRRRGLA